MSYAQVIVDISHENVDRPFSYRISEELKGQICAGSKVEVPFGKGNRLITGYVVGFCDKVDYDESKRFPLPKGTSTLLPAQICPFNSSEMR